MLFKKNIEILVPYNNKKVNFYFFKINVIVYKNNKIYTFNIKILKIF